MEKCAESVWHQDGNWGRSHGCSRSSGFGPESKYCRQHAEKYTTEGETVTWYRADRYTDYSCAVTPVEVLKETEAYLVVKGTGSTSREKKTSDFYRYFRSKDEAIDFYRKRVQGLRSQADALERRVNEL